MKKPPQPVKQKSCGCCAEKTRLVLKGLRHLREQTKEHQEQYKQALLLYTRYGPEEGLRRIKKDIPAVAAQFERFIEKYAESPQEKIVGASPRAPMSHKGGP